MDEQAKKKSLRMFTYGLYVVGTVSGAGIPHAFTCTWLSQCSFKPPLLMMGVQQDSLSRKNIDGSGVFTVNVLADDQRDIAKIFFDCPAPQDGQFGDVQFRPGTNGSPVLEVAPAYLECRVQEVIDRGDHSVVIGEVVEASAVRPESTPLVLRPTGWNYGG